MTIRKISGSADNPVQDGSVRGLIGGAMLGLLSFIGSRIGLTDNDIVVLAPVVVFASFAAAGAWDKWIKPRLAA